MRGLLLLRLPSKPPALEQDEPNQKCSANTQCDLTAPLELGLKQRHFERVLLVKGKIIAA
jgi:hypothetical protein